MKKQLLILSAALVLGSISLAGCNNPGDTSSSEPASTSTPAPVAGNIIIAEDADDAADYDLEVLPKNIQLKQTVDLEKHVLVTRVDTWSISIVEGEKVVSIDGHRFTATGLGDYKIKITAGSTVRSFSGQVVTKSKINFNNAFNSLKRNYTVSGEFSGWIDVTDNYWMTVDSVNELTGRAVFSGGISENVNATKATRFELNATIGQTDITFGDAINVKPGFDRSSKSHNFGKNFGEFTGDEFVMSFDEDGDPTPYYILKDGDETNYSTKVSRFIDSITGSDTWSTMLYYCNPRTESESEDEDEDYERIEEADLAAFYSEGTLFFYPVVNGQVVETFVYQGKSYDMSIQVSDIGESNVDACEAWLENPSYPDQLDITELKGAFEDVGEARNYSLDVEGQWYDSKSAIDCPKNMHFSDTHTALFGNFHTQAFNNGTIVEETCVSIADDVTSPAESIPNPTAGESEMYFVNNRKLYGAHTSLDDTTQEEEYGQVQLLNSGNDITNDDNATVFDVEDFLTPNSLFGMGEKGDVLDKCSFLERKQNTDGSLTFVFNLYGDDREYQFGSVYETGAAGAVSESIPFYMGFIPMAYCELLEWWTSVDLAFTLQNDAIVFTFTFEYSSTINYVITWNLHSVGQTEVSAKALAVYNGFVNPDQGGDEVED